jgi:sugar/nucleoside kinase (ribokinase family)
MNIDKKYDVIVVGELNVDLILNQIENFPSVGKEVLANQMTLTLGSSSAIFASNLSVLGSSVTYIGKLGNDNFGDHIINALRDKGVDTSNIIFSGDKATGATIVLNYMEDRAMVTYPGAMSELTILDITDEALLSAKHLHVSSVFLQHGLKPDLVQLFKRAKGLGLTTSMDPQWDPAEEWDIPLPDLLPYVDIFMPNVAELKAFTRARDLETSVRFINKSANTIVIKDGNKGAYLCEGETFVHQPAFLNTNVVDSIGAGDSFDAGFIHRFIQGQPARKCLEFGALTGAISTTANGGTGAFETASHVKEIARSSFNYTF